MKLVNLLPEALKPLASSGTLSKPTLSNDYFEREKEELEIYSWSSRIVPKNPWISKHKPEETREWLEVPKPPLKTEDLLELSEPPRGSSEPVDMKEWLINETKKFLETTYDHPLFAIQRKAVSLYKDRKFKLRRQITYSSLIWKRGTEGWTLDALSLGLFQGPARKLLEEQLQKPLISLCSLGEYVYTIPNSYLKFEGDKEGLDLF